MAQRRRLWFIALIALVAQFALANPPASAPATQAGSIDRKIDDAIRGLGDPSFEARQEATRLLSAYRATAEDALLRAVAGDDPEVVARAKDVLSIPRVSSSADPFGEGTCEHILRYPPPLPPDWPGPFSLAPKITTTNTELPPLRVDDLNARSISEPVPPQAAEPLSRFDILRWPAHRFRTSVQIDELILCDSDELAMRSASASEIPAWLWEVPSPCPPPGWPALIGGAADLWRQIPPPVPLPPTTNWSSLTWLTVSEAEYISRHTLSWIERVHPFPRDE